MVSKTTHKNTPEALTLYISRQEIEQEVRDYGQCDVALGAVNSEDRDYEGDAEYVRLAADGLLKLFRIDTERWTDHLAEVYDASRTGDEDQAEVVEHFKTLTMPLGTLLHDLAYEGLPIEDHEDGDTSVGLLLQLNDSLKVAFQGQGHCWFDDDDEVGYEIKFTGAVTAMHD